MLRNTAKDRAALISFVLPAYNEAENIAAMAKRLAEVCTGVAKHEIVFVDDGSTDGTLLILRELSRRDPAIRFVAFTRNFGHQAALRAGLRHTTGEAVVVLDCDFEHPPEIVPALVEEWRRGARIVLTRRGDTSDRRARAKRFLSRMFYRLLDSIGDVRIEEGSADFVLLDRVVVDTINDLEDQDVFLRGLVRWLGFPLATVAYTQGVRQTGQSKFTMRRMVELAVSGLVAHSVKPLRLAIHLSLWFALVGVIFFAYSLVSFFWIHHTVAGWTSIMSAIAILGAGQFLILGIIGEYIGRILREVRGRPVYLVAETEAASRTAPRSEPRAIIG